MYSEVEQHPAWRDYTHRLVQMRDVLRQQLEQGTQDKHGIAHDDEIRCTLHVINTILSYPHELHKAYTTAEAALRQRNAHVGVNLDNPFTTAALPV